MASGGQHRGQHAAGAALALLGAGGMPLIPPCLGPLISLVFHGWRGTHKEM